MAIMQRGKEASATAAAEGEAMDEAAAGESVFLLSVYELVRGCGRWFIQNPLHEKKKKMCTQENQKKEMKKTSKAFKCGVLASSMVLALAHHLLSLCCSAGLSKEESISSHWNRLFMGTMASATACLLVLLHHTHNFRRVAWIYCITLNLGILCMCVICDAPAEIYAWLAFIPPLLFFILGVRAGLFSLLLILAQGLVVIPLVENLFRTRAVLQWGSLQRTLSIDFVMLAMSWLALAHEAARAQASAKLRRSDSYCRQFLSYLNHALRTPLHGILAMGSDLLEKLECPDDKEAAQIIVDSGFLFLSVLTETLNCENRPEQQLRMASSIIPSSFQLAKEKGAAWYGIKTCCHETTCREPKAICDLTREHGNELTTKKVIPTSECQTDIAPRGEEPKDEDTALSRLKVTSLLKDRPSPIASTLTDEGMREGVEYGGRGDLLKRCHFHGSAAIFPKSSEVNKRLAHIPTEHLSFDISSS